MIGAGLQQPSESAAKKAIDVSELAKRGLEER